MLFVGGFFVSTIIGITIVRILFIRFFFGLFTVMIYVATERPAWPILAGILPLRSSRHAEFLHNEVPGITIPEPIRQCLASADPDTARAEGIRIARDIYNAVYSPLHELSKLDISKDEIPTDKGFVTRRMLSDVNLPEEVRNSTELRPYSGNFDCLVGYDERQYPYMKTKPAPGAAPVPACLRPIR